MNQALFHLYVDGRHFMSGDQRDMRAMFNNLAGVNFNRMSPARAVSHTHWLNTMKKIHRLALPYGAKCALYYPTGALAESSKIGQFLLDCGVHTGGVRQEATAT